MIRRTISTAALLVACAAGYLAAAERATFILTTGERKSGPVVFHTDARENLINGQLNLGAANGKEMTFPEDQVAVIDFVGGRPPDSELQALGTGHTIALRNGGVEQGHFVNMIGGDTVRWQDQNGSSRDIPIREVSRIYLNRQSAMTAFNYNGPTNASNATGTSGTAGQAPGPGAVRVEANQPWTNTGVSVRKGDRVTFQASGQIEWGRSPGQIAGPNGNASDRSQAYPIPGTPVGTLIGKVGNSAPFAIGSNTQPVLMPADGVLMLGVNDNEFGDNSGFFAVVVTKS
jgi:PA-IL-like protein